MEVVAVLGVMDASTMEVVGEAQVQRSRPYFLDLAPPHLELGPLSAISDMSNMYKIKNIRHINKDTTHLVQ